MSAPDENSPKTGESRRLQRSSSTCLCIGSWIAAHDLRRQGWRVPFLADLLVGGERGLVPCDSGDPTSRTKRLTVPPVPLGSSPKQGFRRSQRPKPTLLGWTSLGKETARKRSSTSSRA